MKPQPKKRPAPRHPHPPEVDARAEMALRGALERAGVKQDAEVIRAAVRALEGARARKRQAMRAGEATAAARRAAGGKWLPAILESLALLGHPSSLWEIYLHAAAEGSYRNFKAAMYAEAGRTDAWIARGPGGPPKGSLWRLTPAGRRKLVELRGRK